MAPRRVTGLCCLTIADERTGETRPGQRAARLAIFTSAVGNGGRDDTARTGTRQFGVTMEQARSGIAAGLYRAGLLGRAISLGSGAIMAGPGPDQATRGVRTSRD